MINFFAIERNVVKVNTAIYILYKLASSVGIELEL